LCSKAKVERAISEKIPESFPFAVRFLDEVQIDIARVGFIMPVFPRTVTDFASAFSRAAPPPQAVATIILCVLCGLDFLHSVDCGHCDVKPPNMALKQDGICCLIDYGSCVQVGKQIDLFGGGLTQQYALASTENPRVSGARFDLICLASSIYHIMINDFPANLNSLKAYTMKYSPALTADAIKVCLEATTMREALAGIYTRAKSLGFVISEVDSYMSQLK